MTLFCKPLATWGLGVNCSVQSGWPERLGTTVMFAGQQNVQTPVTNGYDPQLKREFKFRRIYLGHPKGHHYRPPNETGTSSIHFLTYPHFILSFPVYTCASACGFSRHFFPAHFVGFLFSYLWPFSFIFSTLSLKRRPTCTVCGRAQASVLLSCWRRLNDGWKNSKK